ncbi:hypothetical protein DIC66_05040 [Rhodoferax lacus]|uniref:Glycine zipper 2TM domain-containing protein n=1 Tax=Rhodoferax lacus TaxID=2184758 RepID=A0A3E1RFE6_9BURK|nr:glycine zipper 2TM domain-containing protein [Rhodoferax lacus]RFO98089.1 hypothetical protein DIC66_05040 [Rhodoferax lacus]
MSLAESAKRIHPLVAVAAGAVTLFSLVGIAAITGLLPNSYGTTAEGNRDNLQGTSMSAPDQRSADNWDNGVPAAKSQQQRPVSHLKSGNTNVAAQDTAQRNAPVAPPAQPAPVAHKAPQNSPVGIGVGAVVGGVLGNQVGSGDGKTLATILGAVGGGYIGNEIAKKNQ